MFRKILAATAALTLGLGGAIALAVPASATPGNGHGGGQTEHVPVNVCHATSSDTNPFVFITVDDDSVKLKGHLMHRDDPNKTWKSDGVYNSVFHSAGDPKADRIESYTGTDGVYHELDGTFDSCADTTPKQPDPIVEVEKSTIDRMSCEAGVEEKTTTTTYTTPYVWVDGEWVLGKTEKNEDVGDWTFVRDLTQKERDRLECDPDEAVVPTVESEESKACEVPGTYSVTPGVGTTVEVRRYQTPVGLTGEGAGFYTVTATLDEGYEWPADLPLGWTQTEGGIEYTFKIQPSEDCPVIVEVTAAAPGFTDPTCELNQAGLNLPDQDGIDYTVSGSVAPGEKVTVIATLAEGVDNTVLVGNVVWSHTYGDKATDCGKTPPPDKPDKPEPPATELPHTGGSDIAALLTAGLGLMLLGGLALVASRRRKGMIV